MAIVAALVVGLLLAAVPAFADAGDLDRSFDKDGKVTTDFGGSEGLADVVSQPDGKIVAAGSSRVGSDSEPVLMRYKRDGSLDKTFGGGDGIVTPDLLGRGGLSSVALQPDGKIVVLGGANGFALARFDPDGSQDDTFGEGGVVRIELDGVNNYATDHVVQPDGKIVVAGRAFADFFVARFEPDGSPDTAFGEDGDGMVTHDFSSSGGPYRSTDGASVLALQPDGKIIAAGGRSSAADDYSATALIRYNPDGSLDETFGKDGTVSTALAGPGFPEEARDLVVQPNGRIVVAATGGTGQDFILARYRPNGTLDESFGGDGVVTTNFGGYDSSDELVLQPDGKIIAAGETYGSESTEKIALARYKSNGALDRSFGDGDGKVTTSFDDRRFQRVTELAMQPNGRIVAAGSTSTTTVHKKADDDFALARYYTAK